MITKGSDLKELLSHDDELGRLVSIVPSITIIVYDGSNIDCLECTVSFINSQNNLDAIKEIYLLGRSNSIIEENIDNLEEQLPECKVISTTERELFVKKSTKVKYGSFLIHIENRKNSKFGFIPVDGNLDKYVKDSRTLYSLKIKTLEFDIFGSATQFYVESELSLMTLPRSINKSAPEEPTAFCKERMEYINMLLQDSSISQESIFFQTFEEVEHGCENCSQCYDYNDAKKLCPMAQHQIANFYRDGLFVPVDNRIAHQWDTMAARQEYPDAIAQLADDFTNGNGCKKNLKKATKYYSYLIEWNNDRDALTKLIKLCNSEDATNKTIPVQYMVQLASEGDSKIIYQLKEAIQRGDLGLPKDTQQIEYWLELGAQKGEVHLMKQLAEICEAQSKWEKSYLWYKKLYAVDSTLASKEKVDEIELLMLTNAGSIEEISIVGRDFLYGYFGRERDLQSAFRCLNYASKHGSSSAKGLLGHMYYDGIGVEQDTNLGIQYFESAAKENDLYSLSVLVDMYNDEYYTYANGYWDDIIVPAIESGIQRNDPFAYILKSEYLNIGFKYTLDDNASFEYIKHAAELENPAAQFSLYLKFDEGIGCEKDSERAMYWLREAARNGNYEAQGRLGIILYDQFIFSPLRRQYTNEQIFSMLQSAYDQNDKSVCYYLGMMYKNGSGTSKDIEKGKKIIQEAAENGNKDAQRILCNSYFDGSDGFIKDFTLCAKWGEEAIKNGVKNVRFRTAYSQAEIGNNGRAKELYYELCEEGDSAAMNNYAVQLDDAEEKSKWFMKAALAGDDYGCWNLAKRYRYGNGIEKNMEKAIEWYTKAAEKGHKYAMSDLAILYRDGTEISQNGDEAVKWFCKAAAKDEVDAMLSLGRMFRFGTAVDIDTEKAIKYYKMAAENDNVSAMCTLGEIYEESSGNEAAIFWYRKAASRGNIDAKKVLVRMNTNWIEEGKVVDKINEPEPYFGDDDLPF